MSTSTYITTKPLGCIQFKGFRGTLGMQSAIGALKEFESQAHQTFMASITQASWSQIPLNIACNTTLEALANKCKVCP